MIFLRFCGKYGLKQIAENATSFASMFGVTEQRSQLKEETKIARRVKIEF
jgi:hypothetical protein